MIEPDEDIQKPDDTCSFITEQAEQVNPGESYNPILNLSVKSTFPLMSDGQAV